MHDLIVAIRQCTSCVCVHDCVVQLEITEFVPTLLYFGYTLLIVLTFWLLTGTIGFYAAYMFIRRIYGAIKVE